MTLMSKNAASTIAAKAKEWYLYLFFSTLNPLFSLAKKGNLTPKSLPDMPEALSPNDFLQTPYKIKHTGFMDFYWKILTLSPQPPDHTRNIRRHFIITLLLMISRVSVSLMPPYLLHIILSYFEMNHTAPDIIYCILGLCISLFMEGMIISHYFYASQTLGFYIKSYLQISVYKKSLGGKNDDSNHEDFGKILNFMASDSQNVSEAPSTLIEFCHDMFLIFFATLLLFTYLGTATLAPLGFMLLLSPISRMVSKKFSKIDEKRRKIRDHRISILSQVIRGIYTIKHLTLEIKSQKKIRDVRKREVRVLKAHVFTAFKAHSIYGAIQILTAVSGFSLYVLFGNDLTPSIVFPCLALFKMLESPFGDATFYIAELMGSKIALKRIFSYLNTDGKHSRTIVSKEPAVSPKGEEHSSFNKALSVRALGISFKNNPAPILSDIHFDIKPGEKVGIVGPLGSGKSVLLKAIAGEIHFQGAIHITPSKDTDIKTVHFIPQSSMIFNMTIQDNIRLGRMGVVTDDLLKRAHLDGDIQMMPSGIQTEIGENGINLSGGQKKRLSICRALLEPSQLLLLDDPFADVDTKTEKGLIKTLIENKSPEQAILIATHRFNCLSQMDRILFLKDGKLSAQGTLDELLENNQDFNNFYNAHVNTVSTQSTPPVIVYEHSKQHIIDRSDSDYHHTAKEDQKIGGIERSVYAYYIRMLGHPQNQRKRYFILILLFMAAFSGAVLPVIQDLWLTVLTSKGGISGWFTKWFSFGEWGMHLKLIIYTILGALSLLGLSISHFMWLSRSLSAAAILHDSALNRMIQAPARFFDTNPEGRIINRFSGDMDEIDIPLGETFKKLIFAIINAAVQLCLIISVVPLLLVVLPFLGILSICIQKRYVCLTREIKRLSLINQSPVLSFFKETLSGIDTIRSYGATSHFTRYFCNLLNMKYQSELCSMRLRWWYYLRNDCINTIMVGAVSISCLYLFKEGILSPALSGIAITYSLMFIYAIPRIVENYGDVQNQMTSVERLMHYRQIPPEEPSLLAPPVIHHWPASGEIIFDNVSLRYDKQLPWAVQNISFSAQKGEILGIVGRTGIGKSTLFKAILRMIPIEKGEIRIDGINILKTNLMQLRSQISMVSQEPFLFKGSIWSNIDPHETFPPDVLKEKLMALKIGSVLPDIFGETPFVKKIKMETLSAGEKQIICLVRSFISKAPILLLDEATASIDPLTEAFIQKLLKQIVQTKTVLIIAHRPETIRFCDTILNLSSTLDDMNR